MQLRGDIYNPTIAEAAPNLIAFERQTPEARELFIYDHASRALFQVTARSTLEERTHTSGLFGNGASGAFFEGRLTWRPERDDDGRLWFVFVSSAAADGFGLYLGYFDRKNRLSEEIFRLPFDGHADMPDWSPQDDRLIFAGRQAGAQGYQVQMAYFMNGVCEEAANRSSVSNFHSITTTTEPEGILYPVWSPDGDKVAYQAKRGRDHGFSNWGIHVLNAPYTGGFSTHYVTEELDNFQEYKPSWAPDGNRIAYYISNAKIGDAEGGFQQDIGVSFVTLDAQGHVVGSHIAEGKDTGMFRDRIQVGVRQAEIDGPLWVVGRDGRSALLYVKVDPGRDPLQRASWNDWSNGASGFNPYDDLSEGWNSILHREPAFYHCEKTGASRYVFVSQEDGQLRLQVRDTGDLRPCEVAERKRLLPFR